MSLPIPSLKYRATLFAGSLLMATTVSTVMARGAWANWNVCAVKAPNKTCTKIDYRKSAQRLNCDTAELPWHCSSNQGIPQDPVAQKDDGNSGGSPGMTQAQKDWAAGMAGDTTGAAGGATGGAGDPPAKPAAAGGNTAPDPNTPSFRFIGQSPATAPPGSADQNAQIDGHEIYKGADGKMYGLVTPRSDGRPPDASAFVPVEVKTGKGGFHAAKLDDIKNAPASATGGTQTAGTTPGANQDQAKAGATPPSPGSSDAAAGADGAPAHNPNISGPHDPNGNTPAENRDVNQTDIARADTERREGYKNEEARTKGGSTDECSTSANLSGEFSCDSTRTMITTAQVTNVLAQTVGSVATATVGNSAQQTAMAQGTQSAALRGAASTQRTTGDIQVTSGTVNLAMGLVQFQMGRDHKKNVNQIDQATGQAQLNMVGMSNGKINQAMVHNGDGAAEGQSGYVNGGSELTNKAIRAFSLQTGKDSGKISTEVISAAEAATRGADGMKVRQTELAAREKEMQIKSSQVRSNLKSIGDNASNEQIKIAKEAQAGAFTSLLTGASQMISGGFNLVAANQLDATADKLNSIENMQNAGKFTPISPTSLGAGDALAPRTGTSITGTGATGDAQAAQDDSVSKDKYGDLGAPIGTPQKDALLKDGPQAGKFVAKESPMGGGGAGGAPGGGGSTQAATGSNDDPQAKMADTRGGGAYDGGGSGFTGGGGMGGGGGKDPDLSGMLAQFLPKKEEEAKNPNGILDFGGRSPAAEGPISLLDKNANIFDRIHETYQDKNRRGKVGI
jgi:hypothetical protein